MPCYVDDRSSDTGDTGEELTEILCSACRSLERLGYDFDENPSLSKWWYDHKKKDEERKKEEEKQRLKHLKAQSLIEKPFKSLTSKDLNLLDELGYL